MTADALQFARAAFSDASSTDGGYLDPGRATALSALVDALVRGGTVAVVEGQAGSGKSSFLARLRLELETRSIAIVDAEDLVGHRPMEAAGSQSPSGTPGDQGAPVGRPAALLLDDPDQLAGDALARLRALWSSHRHEGVSLVATSKPAPTDARNNSPLAQLKAMSEHVVKLAPLDLDGIDGLIDHRLRAAGYSGPALFTPASIEKIAFYVRGNPRRIVQLCAKVLDMADSENCLPVQPGLVREAAHEIFLPDHVRDFARKMNRGAVPVPRSLVDGETSTAPTAPAEVARPAGRNQGSMEHRARSLTAERPRVPQAALRSGYPSPKPKPYPSPKTPSLGDDSAAEVTGDDSSHPAPALAHEGIPPPSSTPVPEARAPDGREGADTKRARSPGRWRRYLAASVAAAVAASAAGSAGYLLGRFADEPESGDAAVAGYTAGAESSGRAQTAEVSALQTQAGSRSDEIGQLIDVLDILPPGADRNPEAVPDAAGATDQPEGDGPVTEPADGQVVAVHGRKPDPLAAVATAPTVAAARRHAVDSDVTAIRPTPARIAEQPSAGVEGPVDIFRACAAEETEWVYLEDIGSYVFCQSLTHSVAR